MVDDTERDDKHVSYKLTNSWSEHQTQLRHLLWDWAELKPDVCMITEVSRTPAKFLKTC